MNRLAEVHSPSGLSPFTTVTVDDVVKAVRSNHGKLGNGKLRNGTLGNGNLGKW